MDNKHIMISLGDDKAKHVSEVIGSKSCNRILGLLADGDLTVSEIARKLKMPMNTVDYNVKKLVKAGLVEKAAHWWSVKGKKMPTYKVSNKKIIISPRSDVGKKVVYSFLMVFALVAVVGLIVFLNVSQEGDFDFDLKQFVSDGEFQAFVNESGEGGYNYFGGGETMAMAESLDSLAGGSAPTKASDFSTTNIQVEGVDEADIVKNDGEYIYVVSGRKVVILDAFPADEMNVLSEMNFSGSVNEIFVNDDKLVVFGWGIVDTLQEEGDSSAEILPVYSRSQNPAVLTYDISDRGNPILENSVVLDGNYVDSRMIGDYVYVVSSKNVYVGVEPPIHFVNGVERVVVAEDVYYPTFRDNSYQFTSVSVINLGGGEFDTETYLLGTSYTMYVSENNIYLTQFKSASREDYLDVMIEDVYLEILPKEYKDKVEEIREMDEYYDKERALSDVLGEWFESMEGQEVSDLEDEMSELVEGAMVKISKLQKTAIYKVELDGMDIEYIENGAVPGMLLDQFSMDEYDGNLRVVTTTGNSWWGWGSESLNHLYVLDGELDVIGSVEDLAEGERIYSSRFMGDKAYMVTFRQVDPLFVLDLSDPENPTVLGELKITGYSDYLHPYDENHLIGIGKDATEEGIVQGLKVSLFDVSDVANPIEVAKILIGDRGTSSDALYDHKAVLFDKEKGMLVLPVDLYEVGGEDRWGKFVWQGAYVLDISPGGISERGRISHQVYNESEDFYKQYQSSIRRSLYMDDVLYTISQTNVKANYLDSLDEISDVVISEGVDVYVGVREVML